MPNTAAIYDVAIIGFGFTGLMVLNHLAQQKGVRVVVFDDAPAPGKGAAYATQRVEHLLNVRADRMGAFPGQVDHFYRWLSGHSGRAAVQACGYSGPIQPESFVPRRVYGDYLSEIYRETLKTAQKNGVRVQVIAARVTGAVRQGTELLVRDACGGEILARALVVATGNMFASDVAGAGITHQPWRFDYGTLQDAEAVAVIGTGLTAVDTILSLVEAGYTGRILCVSRGGRFPQVHDAKFHTVALPDMVAHLQGSRLSGYLQQLRMWVHDAAVNGTPWQAVVDAIRPHMVALWENLPLMDRERFLKKYFTWWNIHRHRMAPAVYDMLQCALAGGRVTLVPARFMGMENGKPVTMCNGVREVLDVAMTFNCTGPGYHVLPECLTPLLEQGVLERHALGLGLQVMQGHRVSVPGAPPIFAAGNLVIGEGVETTAVPELRAQAEKIAAEIMATL